MWVMVYLCYVLYFNSHAHVERDHGTMCYNIDTVISTHTLTWSVTVRDYGNLWQEYISTHTLTWSVTKLFAVSVRTGYFNSHAHVERDNIPRSAAEFDKNFNSHAHVERDAIAYNVSPAIVISTHTLTWSVTRSRLWV